MIEIETFGATGTLLRETKGEVVLVSRLPRRMSGLERLNPALPPEAITAAGDELTRDRSAMSLEAANREVSLLLKEGLKVSVPDTDSTPHPGPTAIELSSPFQFLILILLPREKAWKRD